MTAAVEVNFDGLIGPTHNYAGLAHGNMASAANEGQASNPREAALQGLAKMRALMEMGLPQAVLPPHERPLVGALRRMGFTGADRDIVHVAGMASPTLLANVSSASAMWTANAATVSPSADAADGRVHLTVANLSSHLHRSIEAPTTERVLRSVFRDESRFAVHSAVSFPTFGDEGAANHCRLAKTHGDKGVELFVHGGSALSSDREGKFRARQAIEASHIVATSHGLARGSVLLAQQSQAAIDAGAFHNDVVAVSNETVLMFHEHAFDRRDALLEQIVARCEAAGFTPELIEAKAADVSLEDAIRSYLFNSQIVTRPDGAMALILPREAEETHAAKAFVENALARNGAIREARYLDLRQSMRNGGGPACLRLRVVLTTDERAALGANVILDDARLDALEAIVRKHYRDRLALADLADPDLLDESRAALDQMAQLLELGAVYDFQRA
jgi:succinylarginine dihydrolase